MITFARVDWFIVLRDLLYEAKMTHAEIARAMPIKCSRRTLGHLASGGEPLHSRGEALKALYRAKLNREPPIIDLKGKKLPQGSGILRASGIGQLDGGIEDEQQEPQQGSAPRTG